MKTKILPGIAVSIIIAVIAGAVWWKLRTQVITFDDGARLTLMIKGANSGVSKNQLGPVIIR